MKKEIGTIKDCFDTILQDNKERSRLAARKVRKLLYNTYTDGREIYKEIAETIEKAPMNYVKISENWRQENFVMAISVIYFLHEKENQPDFLFPWLFQLLQHQNGYIRYSAVKMISHEIGPLTYHIRFYKERLKLNRPSTEQADYILHSLFINLNMLADSLYEPKYKKYKYIDSLPASPYKSVQMILADLEESCCEQKYL